ncbi:MAG: S8 family serine peptidase, partial [Wenzhouxiangella sp.]
MATSAWGGEIIAVRDSIPNQYIVVLKSESFDQKASARGSDHRQQVHDVVRSIGRQHRSRPGQVFTDAIQGFTVSMNSRGARRLARDPRVAYVTEDSWVRATGADVQFDPPSWGLDRIDQREQGLDGAYRHMSFSSDEAVHVYVIDSGIRSTHQ